MPGAIDTTRLARSSARLGDAIIDAAIWPDILHEISMAVGAEGAILLQSDARTPDVPRSEGVIDPFKRYFKDGWHARDLRADRGVPLQLRGVKVITDADIVTPDEMRRSEYYNDCVWPSGTRWFGAIGFRAGSALWALSIYRTAAPGPFEQSDKPLLAALSNRLTEIATLSTAVGRAALLGIVNALNLIPQAAIAIDRSGFVTEVNDSAAALFDEDIRVSFRRLVLKDPDAKTALDIVLDQIRTKPDQAILAVEPIIAHRKRRPPILIKALAVDGAARGPFLGARVLLLLTELGPKQAPKEVLLMRAYGLSPSEARLAARLATGTALETIADEFGLSPATLRNQLKAIFVKTDTHRQGELVALLAKL